MIVARVRQFVCGVLGHAEVLHFEAATATTPARISMRCHSCGHDSPGWEIRLMGEQTLTDLRLLGLRVREKVSGFTGIVTSISYDLTGCIQAVVAPVVDDKGGLPDGRWFDVSRLEVLDEKPVMEIPGGRFNVDRVSKAPVVPSQAPGPAAKPIR